MGIHELDMIHVIETNSVSIASSSWQAQKQNQIIIFHSNLHGFTAFKWHVCDTITTITSSPINRHAGFEGTRSTIFCVPTLPTISIFHILTSKASIASFITACLSYDKEDLKLTADLSAVEGIIHASQTALETVLRLMLKRNTKDNGAVHWGVKKLRELLNNGQQGVFEQHERYFEEQVVQYLQSFIKISNICRPTKISCSQLFVIKHLERIDRCILKKLVLSIFGRQIMQA